MTVENYRKYRYALTVQQYLLVLFFSEFVKMNTEYKKHNIIYIIVLRICDALCMVFICVYCTCIYA